MPLKGIQWREAGPFVPELNLFLIIDSQHRSGVCMQEGPGWRGRGAGYLASKKKKKFKFKKEKRENLLLLTTLVAFAAFIHLTESQISVLSLPRAQLLMSWSLSLLLTGYSTCLMIPSHGTTESRSPVFHITFYTGYHLSTFLPPPTQTMSSLSCLCLYLACFQVYIR